MPRGGPVRGDRDAERLVLRLSVRASVNYRRVGVEVVLACRPASGGLGGSTIGRSGLAGGTHAGHQSFSSPYWSPRPSRSPVRTPPPIPRRVRQADHDRCGGDCRFVASCPVVRGDARRVRGSGPRRIPSGLAARQLLRWRTGTDRGRRLRGYKGRWNTPTSSPRTARSVRMTSTAKRSTTATMRWSTKAPWPSRRTPASSATTASWSSTTRSTATSSPSTWRCRRGARNMQGRLRVGVVRLRLGAMDPKQ